MVTQNSLPVSVVTDSASSSPTDHVRHLLLNLVPRIVRLSLYLLGSALKDQFIRSLLLNVIFDHNINDRLINDLPITNSMTFYVILMH